MSLLAPLFFLGGLAIGLPILFHLIRRAPTGRVAVSSLMFLDPSPPRISRRSRLDNWLLLLLRALAILLVAAAFARPFLRSTAATTEAGQTGYTVVLLDRSASMRRGDAWQQALERVETELESLGRNDRAALVVYDSTPHVLHGFESVSGGNDPRAEADVMRASLAGVEPTWRASDLGTALITAAEAIDDAARGESSGEARRTVVVVSDLQDGSSLAALRGFEWPAGTHLRLETVRPAGQTNASLGIAGDGTDPASATEEDRMVRVRISNAAESESGNFRVRWKDAQGSVVGTAGSAVTVPPGTTRVARVPTPPESATAIELVGDDHSFDNTHFVVFPEPTTQRVLFVGQDVADPRASLLYYLERISLESPYRRVTVESIEPDAIDTGPIDPGGWDPSEVPLVVLAAVVPRPVLGTLERYLDQGGRVLVVVDQSMADEPEASQLVQQLSGDSTIEVGPAEVSDYALLSRIDFSSPLFQEFADPRFSDFTKIQFWKHQRLEGGDGDWSTPAWFDDGMPAVMRRTVGEGQLFLLGAGWQATESQLALSTKFVPIIAAMIGEPDAAARTNHIAVGSLPPIDPSDAMTIHAPDGRTIPFAQPRDAEEIDRPGLYRWEDGERQGVFAVNVPPEEGETTPLDRSVLEQMGIPFTDQITEVAQAEAERQLRDAELESRQQWWRVLIVAALGLIGLETLLSARRPRAAVPTGST